MKTDSALYGKYERVFRVPERVASIDYDMDLDTVIGDIDLAGSKRRFENSSKSRAFFASMFSRLIDDHRILGCKIMQLETDDCVRSMSLLTLVVKTVPVVNRFNEYLGAVSFKLRADNSVVRIFPPLYLCFSFTRTRLAGWRVHMWMSEEMDSLSSLLGCISRKIVAVLRDKSTLLYLV